MTNAQDLIDLSVSETRIVAEHPATVAEARALLEDLGAEADDDCDVWTHISGEGYSGSEATGYYDVWGTTEDGGEWRVHVVTAEVAADAQAQAKSALVAGGYTVHERSPGPGLYLAGMAPDSGGGDTSPGSAWDEKCDAILAAVTALVEPLGCTAEWADDDIVIEVAS